LSRLTDDLTWVEEDGGEVVGKKSSMASAIVSGRTIKRSMTAATLAKGVPAHPIEEAKETCHRVQVLFDDGWSDFAEAEGKLICDELAKGNETFELKLRGHKYKFDLSSPDEATQMNVKSGKRRRIRILDAPHLEDDESTSGASREEVELQKQLGPQSKRGDASQKAIAKYLQDDKHAWQCFEFFERNEAKYCGEWAVFYHSFSFAALIYEVHAAVASVLFRFRSQYASLPRILVHEFLSIPDAPTLMHRFETVFAHSKRDHNPAFRKVAISAMCSLAATGPEACTARIFVSGYSCKDVSFRSVLESVLETCYVPKKKIVALATQIIKCSEKHGLDVSQFGGKPCQSGKAGHLLQVFIKRSLVDHLVYAAEPYGPVDQPRMPLSGSVNSGESQIRGQVRIVCNPKHFMQANMVRMFVQSADPTFHKNRVAFQKELCGLIQELAAPELRERAAQGIYGGTLPAWWTAEDQRKLL